MCEETVKYSVRSAYRFDGLTNDRSRSVDEDEPEFYYRKCFLEEDDSTVVCALLTNI